ncbi:hypothetical protein [Terrabacter terrae]
MSRKAHLVSPSGLVHVFPPTPGNPYWRAEWRDAFGRRRQTHVGRSSEDALRKAAEVERRLLAASEVAANARFTRDLLDAYKKAGMEPARGKRTTSRAPWSDGYSTRVGRLLSKDVYATLGSVPLRKLSKHQVRGQLARCASLAEANSLRSILSAAVGYGVAKGFLRDDQARACDVDLPDLPSSSRRQRQIPVQGESPDFVSSEMIPTDAMIAALAEAKVTYRLWSGLVHVLAYAGLRVHEALSLTADDVLHGPQDTTVLRVNKQLVELTGGGIRLTPPKNGKARSALVIDITPTDFPLAAWLWERARAARREQRDGLNPDALIFPSSRGRTYWRLRNLRARQFVPAAEAAGWPYTKTTWEARFRAKDALVITQTPGRLWQHPIHALRHRYATTALEVWGWSSSEVCVNGGWASPEFVWKHYVGVAKDASVTAARKQREATQRRLVEVGPHRPDSPAPFSGYVTSPNDRPALPGEEVAAND